MSHYLENKKLKERIAELQEKTGASNLEVLEALVSWFESRSTSFQKDHADAWKATYKLLEDARNS